MPILDLLNGAQLYLFQPDLLGSNSSGAGSNLLPNKTASDRQTGGGYWREQKWVKRGDKLCGPYLYLRWRQDGKLKSKYLGKAIQQPPAGDAEPAAEGRSISEPDHPIK